MLQLRNDVVFHGRSFGAEVSCSGELVFQTGMVGYPESLTDPSYEGQILVLTNPIIGNYGVPSEVTELDLPKHFESQKIHIAGLVVAFSSPDYSHYQAFQSLAQWLAKFNVPALSGVDTRALTKIIAANGTMLARILISTATLFPQQSKISGKCDKLLLAALKNFRLVRFLSEV